MKGSLYTLCYAAVLGTTCALLLAGVDQITGPYKRANARAERILNILTVLKVPLVEPISPRQTLEIFETNVREEKIGALIAYSYADPSNPEAGAVALGFQGQGLWGPIKGFLALRPDMKTIQGITIYEQEETPGLGAEIASAWFKDQFKGKSIFGTDGKPGIYIKQGGGAETQNEVDAITGATMTCEKLQSILNGVIEQLAEEKLGV
jgi:Na+-transporting NADH:ubiquinone oxidoreductase subunit C